MQGVSNTNLSPFISFKPGKRCRCNRVQPKRLQVCGEQWFWTLPLTLGAAELRYNLWLSKTGLSLPGEREQRSNCSLVPGSSQVGSRHVARSVTQPGCPSSPSTQVAPAELFQSLALRNKTKWQSLKKKVLSTSNLGYSIKFLAREFKTNWKLIIYSFK